MTPSHGLPNTDHARTRATVQYAPVSAIMAEAGKATRARYAQ